MKQNKPKESIINLKDKKITDVDVFIKNGHIFESMHTYELCPVLKSAFASLPVGAKIYVDLDESTGTLNSVTLLPDNPVGCRVKVEDWFIYLFLGNDFTQKIGLKHRGMLSSGLYYIPNKEVLEYWEKPDDVLNKAEDYAKEAEFGKSVYLQNIIQKYCDNIDSALEIGCNVGRNLYFLNSNLNIAVSGIEISKHALSLLPKYYPTLQKIKVWQGNVVEIIPSIPDNYADVVFSMAVLMHLHPTTPDFFWEHVVRIANKYIITIENEHGATERNWKRNYQELLEKHGVRQIHTEKLTNDDSMPDLKNYTTRIFKKH
jgi:SAM-dependent methyltransferase